MRKPSNLIYLLFPLVVVASTAGLLSATVKLTRPSHLLIGSTESPVRSQTHSEQQGGVIIDAGSGWKTYVNRHIGIRFRVQDKRDSITIGPASPDWNIVHFSYRDSGDQALSLYKFNFSDDRIIDLHGAESNYSSLEEFIKGGGYAQFDTDFRLVSFATLHDERFEEAYRVTVASYKYPHADELGNNPVIQDNRLFIGYPSVKYDYLLVLELDNQIANDFLQSLQFLP